MKRIALLTVVLLAGCTDLATQPAPQSAYTLPEDVGDGWLTSRAADEGFSEDNLAELVDRIEDGSYTNIHSVVLARHGRLVFEAYFPGFTTADRRHVEWERDSLHAVHSVTKSVTSTLIGIALDQGLIESVEVPVSKFFPEHADLFVGSKADLTLKHLLTMTAGLDFDEHTHTYHDPRNSHVQMNRSGDPIGYTLRLPLIYEPGEVFKYNSGLSMLLGEIIRRVSGESADKFAAQHLFEPLGIEEFYWYTYPDGTVQTGGGLYLRPRDMARLGQLYLNGGIWGSRRLLSEEWSEQATSDQTATSSSVEDYGYHWWILTLPRHDNAFDLSDHLIQTPAAVGWGGQWVFFNPDLDIVAVFTAGNDNKLSNQPLDILRRYIFSAILQ